MPVSVVVDTQWGDGGKGKFVDAVASDMDLIIRFNGGANAGYTVVVQEVTHKLHLMPAGILHEGKMNVIGPGVVYDLAIGQEELFLARRHGAKVALDHAAPVVLPIHRAIDFGRETMAVKMAIGTTKRGIGPCYEDVASRRSLTLGDLVAKKRIKNTLTSGGYWKEKIALSRHLQLHRLDLSDLQLGIDPMSFDDTVDWCMKYALPVREHLTDTRALVHEAFRKDRKLLFQGVNSILLDIFMGAKPYCTSSICTPSGISATFGIYHFDRVIGIVKAYNTRVGGGPFPTEIDGEMADLLRRRGNEYGTTTGRPRRCGWLDLPALLYSCRIGGVRELVLTKLDVLSGLPQLHICHSYGFQDEFQTLTKEILENARPVLVSCETWNEGLSGIKNVGDLPPATQRYVSKIAAAARLPITSIGVGPERSQFISS